MDIRERVRKLLGENGTSEGRRRRILAGGTTGVLLVVLILVTGILRSRVSSGEVMGVAAQHQPLVGLVVQRGSLKAANTVSYSAPRMRQAHLSCYQSIV